MSAGELYIVLGCFGRTDDGFVSCSGIDNIILKTSPSDSNYDEIMDYFDSLQLFDRQIMNYNAARHFVHNMQDKFDLPTKRLWSEKMFLLYQKFVIDHRDCGVCIKLQLADNEDI
ncbi:hypothetical protein LCGC14_0526220 [marine sediment metagenome]|uniref:Uncharacterized protein n=1 Tax=marine sediment metagenome TaxID=412755 RepID=A0A0F9SFD3_9ZZZZ